MRDNSFGLSSLPNSLLSHCSHGGNSFTAETFVNDDRESGRRLRRWPERPSLTKVSAVKHAPPCETMDHTRPFQCRWSRAGAARAFFQRTGPDECC